MLNCAVHALRLLLCLAAYASADWAAFSQSYGILTTVAGRGVLGGGGGNYWLAEFEGASAVNAELSNPHMAMADSAGNIYIADKEAHAIRKVTAAGFISTAAGTNIAGDGVDGRAIEQPLNSPNGVWVNKKGDFYILDLGNDKIRKVTTDSMMSTVVDDSLGMSLGRGLWVSAAEDTIWYSSGSQIKMWTLQTGIVSYATGFSALGNIVQDRNGIIVATDRSASRVYRVDNQGQKTVIAGNGQNSGAGDGFPALENAFYGVRGVWFLDDNSYFLGTHEGSQVWYIDADGIAHLFLNGREGDEYHSGDNEYYRTSGDKISEVRAVTVDYQGNVLITENDRGFVRRVEKGALEVQGRRAALPRTPFIVREQQSLQSLKLTLNTIASGNVHVRIIDQRGRLVENIRYSTPGGSGDFYCDVRHLPPGVYMILVENARRTNSGKFIQPQ